VSVMSVMVSSKQVTFSACRLMPVLAALDMIATKFLPSIHDLFSTILSQSFLSSALIGIDKP